MRIALVDVVRQFRTIEAEVRRALERVLENGDYVMGEDVAAFEQEFAQFCGASHAVAVSSGTDALVLALRALDIGPGDEVVTVPFTFAATVEAIVTVGARPVFVDVDRNTALLDPQQLAKVITARTRAIIPVHLYGFPCDMDAICEIGRRRGLRIVEDASQAHGAEFGGRRVGAIGDIGCFSFYPGKNIGAFGEAGAVVTQHAELADRIRLMRNHGSADKYHHVRLGWNCRMDTLQAAILRVKLRHLERWNEARRQVAHNYTRRLGVVDGLGLPPPCVYGRPVFHLYVVRVPWRDQLREYLAQRGIATGVHYPIPLHLQEAFAELGHKAGDFPVSEEWAGKVLSLPTFPELEDSEIAYVAEALRAGLTALGASSRGAERRTNDE
jgi:dTDP-4-amino-4,6-dideoxygalactose transaminase